MKNLDFTKLLIWSCVVLSLLGVGGHLYLKKRIETAEKESKAGLMALKAISIAHEDIRVLEDEKKKDKYLEDRDKHYRTYFAEMAGKAGLSDEVSVSAPVDRTPAKVKDYRDRMYLVEWGKDRNNNKLKFERKRIAAFLWYLENETSLLKVTKMRMQQEIPKSGDPDDRWELIVEVTERLPVAATSDS